MHERGALQRVLGAFPCGDDRAPSRGAPRRRAASARRPRRGRLRPTVPEQSRHLSSAHGDILQSPALVRSRSKNRLTSGACPLTYYRLQQASDRGFRAATTERPGNQFRADTPLMVRFRPCSSTAGTAASFWGAGHVRAGRKGERMCRFSRCRSVARRRRACAAAAVVTVRQGIADDRRGRERERHLFIWAGDQKRIGPDFLAVVDFDADSQRYGEVIRTVPVPGPGASGNEPHHVGLSSDGRTLARRRPPQRPQETERDLLLRRVAAGVAPLRRRPADPPQSAITDEFYALPDGGFLVTMMGGSEAASSRPRRRVRSRLQHRRRASAAAAGRRIQSARDFGPARAEPDGDERLHLSVDDAQRRAGRSRSARQHPRVVARRGGRSSRRSRSRTRAGRSTCI